MYNCTFIKYLWKDNEVKRKRLYKTLVKELCLPFPPQLGYEITEEEWFSGVIERIVWNNHTQVFSIKVIDITPKDGVSADLLLEIAQKQGWKIRQE